MQLRYIRILALVLGGLALALGGLAPPPASAAGPQWTPYRAADGRWSIEYPADALSPEDLGNGVTIFISRDRSTFVAVDSYAAAGKTGRSDLHARAKRALARIYGAAPRSIQPLSQFAPPWEAGVSFATAKGSQGAALYLVEGHEAGAWGYGALFGFKATSSEAQRDLVYQTLARLQIASIPAGSDDRPSVELIDRVAREKVAIFLQLLSAGKYRAAAAHFGGDYAALRDMNPDLAGEISGNEALQEQLLKRACAANGYNCLRMRRILEVRVYSPDEAVVVVELSNPNGSRFALPADGRTAFEFRVRRIGGQYFVMDLPPYSA